MMSIHIQYQGMKTNFILSATFINNAATLESNLTYPDFTTQQTQLY